MVTLQRVWTSLSIAPDQFFFRSLIQKSSFAQGTGWVAWLVYPSFRASLPKARIPFVWIQAHSEPTISPSKRRNESEHNKMTDCDWSKGIVESDGLSIKTFWDIGCLTWNGPKSNKGHFGEWIPKRRLWDSKEALGF